MTECTWSIFATYLACGVVLAEDYSVNIELSDGWTDVFKINFQTSYAQPDGITQCRLSLYQVQILAVN